MTHLPCIEIEIETGTDSGIPPRWSVIWLHGLGADGSDFVPIVPELGLPPDAAVRFIFPHAPEQAVTCNGGYVMRAWYDIISLEPNHRQIDRAGLLASREAIRALIARENTRGIPCERIVLAGFSQGGAVAYLTALTHPQALAGVIALSTYIPDPTLLRDEASSANQQLPILAAHGSHDDVVSLALGEQARQLLISLGQQPEWHTYPMAHAVCPAEIDTIGAWLRQRLPS